MFLLWVSLARGGEVVLEAEHLSVENGAVEATGARLAWDGQVLAAASLSLAEGVVRAGAGRWEGPWVVDFAEASLDLSDGSGVLVGAELREGRRLLRAERLAVGAELSGEGLWWTPCGCAPPPWAVRAREATLVPDESLAVRGAALEVVGVAVPLPSVRIPLDHPLRVPRVGWGRDGLEVEVPVAVAEGVVVAPELRWRRGLRVHADATGRWGEASGVGGWDRLEGLPRGAARWDAGWTRSALALATHGSLLSDPGYAADLGESWTERGLPWTLSRARVGWGPVEVAGLLSQDLDTGAYGGWVAGRVDHAVDLPLGAVGRVWGEARGEPDAAVGLAGVQVERSLWAGPVRVTPALTGSLDGAVDGVASTTVGVPLWGEGGVALVPEVRVWGGTPGWGVDPGLTWRRGAGLEVAVAGTVGPEPGARGRVLLARAWGEAEAVAWTDDAWGVEGLAEGRLHLGPVHPEAGWWRAPGVSGVRGGARLDLPLSLRLTGRGTWDLAGGAWRSREVDLRWVHGSGCLEVGVRGRLLEEGPELDGVLVVRP